MKFKSQAHFFAVKRATYTRVKKLIPGITESSGIYVFKRTQKVGNTNIIYAYVGQAKNLLDRISTHLIDPSGGHIDKSIAKRKMIDEGGEWCVYIERFCDKSELDFWEKNVIEGYMSIGWQLPYNKTLGGQGEGKVSVADTEQKGYMKGRREGYDKAYKEVAEILNEYFNLNLKPEAYYRSKLRVKVKDFLENLKNHLTN